MAVRDWSNLGDDLSRIVEDAVNMRNFGRLNEDINKTIDRVFGGYPGEEKKWQKILVQTACWICICMKTASKVQISKMYQSC